VQAYKDDYTVDPSGNIKYGHCTVPMRIGALDRFSSSEWSFFPNIDPDNCATVSQSPFKVQGRGTCNGTATMHRRFIVGSPDPVRIYFSAGIYGLAVEDFSHYAIYERAVGYKIWLWDVTNNTSVHPFDSGGVKTSYPDIQTIELTKTLDPANYSFTFSNPSPGHTYSMSLELNVEGGCSEWYCTPKDFIISIDPISIGIQY
jgi:hypothetical protein